jgi:small subunit ribosomal protein S20
MPNTRSAERRMRNSERKRQHNIAIKSRLRTLEGKYRDLLAARKTDEAATALRAVSSALDKAAKLRVVHPGKADRKKSRLALQFNRAK